MELKHVALMTNIKEMSCTALLHVYAV